MNKGSQCLKVYFEDPFWVGVIERQADHKLEACKITFGSEPKETELLAMLPRLRELPFSPAVSIKVKERAKNYKRRLKESRRELQNASHCTKAQQALKLRQQELLNVRKAERKEQKQAKQKGRK